MRASLLVLVLTTFACSAASTPTPAPEPSVPERLPGRAVVKWLAVDARPGFWLEERLAREPLVQGDRAIGPRAIVSSAGVVWSPAESERLVDACRHPSGAWSGVVVDGTGHVALVHGDGAGLRDRTALADPALADDPRAWLGAPKGGLRLGPFSETGVRIAADGEDVAIGLVSEDFAYLVYRAVRATSGFVVSPHVLVSPAAPPNAILPIGGSYDVFGATLSPWALPIAVAPDGRAFVAGHLDGSRVTRHETALGQRLELLRDVLYPRERTVDVLAAAVDRDGKVAFTTVTGTPDVEDEVFGVAASSTRFAVLGRSRRELGRDNTELHGMVAELARDGARLGTTTIDAPGSAIVQVGVYEETNEATLWLGGSEGWAQNPSGRSVYQNGTAMLSRLEGGMPRTVVRVTPPATSGHAELRAMARASGKLWLGGHENGPLTHTGDADASLVRADGFLEVR